MFPNPNPIIDKEKNTFIVTISVEIEDKMMSTSVGVFKKSDILLKETFFQYLSNIYITIIPEQQPISIGNKNN